MCGNDYLVVCKTLVGINIGFLISERSEEVIPQKSSFGNVACATYRMVATYRRPIAMKDNFEGGRNVQQLKYITTTHSDI